MGHLFSTEIPARVGLVCNRSAFKVGLTLRKQFGWNGAGKTSLVYRMKYDKSVYTTPTIGFNIESFKLFNTNFTVWDVGGRGKVSFKLIIYCYLSIYDQLFCRFVPCITIITTR